MSLDRAREKKWVRPYEALARMTPEQRDNIRDTLKFNWDGATIKAFGYERAQLESWEIVDCDMRGIAARLHTIVEQVNPTQYISWRRALIRALDCLGGSYAADDSEEVLENLLVKAFENNRGYTAREQTSIPGKSLAKVEKRVKVVSEVLSEVAAIWDTVLSSEDWPAITSMYPICKTLIKKTSLV